MALNKFTQIGNSGFGTDTSINTTGIVTAASFSGDGSGLTGVTALGSGVVVQEEGSNVGTAQTINFIGTGVTATFSGGIASVEIATGGSGGGGLSDIVSDTTPQLGGNLDLNSNNITGTGDINITGDATFSGDLDVDGHVNLDNVSIAGVSTFAGITTVTGNTLFTKQLSTTGISTFRSNIDVVNGAIKLKTPTDNDVFSISYNTQNDDVKFHFQQSGGTGGSEVQFLLKDNAAFKIRNSQTAGTIAKFTADGNNELYYDDSKKFETTSTGAIVTGTLVATATTATNVTVANEASDTECFVMFGVNATGDNAPKSSSSLKYNSSTGGLTAGSFIGDGSGLTGITASGSGVIVRDGGSLVGTAGTIDFGSNVSVSPISAGVVTVTASAGSIPGINTSGTTEVNNLIATGVITATSFNGNGASVTNVNAVSIGGTPLTDLQKKNADTDLVMNNQILHFGPANTKSRIRWSGTTSLWDLIDGDLKIRDNLTDRFTFERTTGNFSASNVNVSGIITASSFSGDGSALTNLPASGISTAFTNVQATWSVGGDTSGYTFTGPGQDGAEQNPDIYLVRGQRYRFINGTGSSHPFRIQSDTSGTAYTDGVSGSQSGTQDFNVQHDAPVRLYYQCTIHSGMIGNIYIVGGSDWRMTDVLTNQTPEIFTNLNVGIGTDNPVTNFKLDVNGDLSLGEFGGSDNTYIDQKQNGSLDIINSGRQSSSGGIRINKTNSIGGDTTYFRDFEVYDGKDNLVLLVDGSSGEVGIGTDNPYHELHIQGSGDTRALITSGGTGDAVMMFENASGNTWGHGIDLTNNNYVIAYNGTSDPSLTTDGMFQITGIGSVGVGLANPDSRFHVQSTSNHVATFEYSSTSDCAIQLKNSQGSMYFGLGGGEEFMVGIATDLNGSGNTKLSVDSTGRVRMPDQAAALVYKTGTSQAFSSDGLVNYDATSYSQGGMTINASRNRITVPVAGKYMINACTAGSVTTASAGDGWKLRILRDGSVYNHDRSYPVETTGSSAGQELAYTVSMVVDAAANDYFEIQIENIGSARATMSYGYFGIYLLG